MDQKKVLTLRRRMGWTVSDLGRRLGVDSKVIEIWEKEGTAPSSHQVLTQIEFLLRQADICCDEVKDQTRAESALEKGDLGQVQDKDWKDRGL